MYPKNPLSARMFPLSLRDLLITISILLCAAGVCILLRAADTSDGFASPIFVLAVLLTSRLTTGYLFGLIASVLGVICVNFIFTYPYWAFNLTISGYPLTFLSFLAVSVITSTLTTKIKRQEQLRAENEKEKMRANLLRSVSHDIRTPLTSIVGSTSTVLENPGLSRGEQETLLEDVRSEAQWLIQTVENLLSITRMGDGDAHIHKELEAAEEVLASVAAKFQKRFGGVRLVLTAPQEPLFVPMDAILVEQVLLNLLENAAYHGKSTCIRLSAERREGDAVFTIRDNGCGIAPELLPNLFSPSRQGQTHTSDGRRNMGIGLSVCSSIVRAHGGALAAANAREGGAVFYFTLPTDQPSTEEPAL